MKWLKPDPKLAEDFLGFLPKDTDVITKKMFGYPCAFVNGNMFCGMHNNRIVVRLPEEERKILFKKGFECFEPMKGRIMKEYVVIPDKLLEKKAEVTKLFVKSVQYVKTLPIKKKK